MLSSALRRNIGYRTLENFQKCLLYALTAYITGNRGIFGFSCNLIYFIHIDNASFGFCNIKIRCLNQAQENVFNIFTDIACFCQGRSISNGKRNIQYSCQCLRKKRFTDTGRTEKKDIAFVQCNIIFILIVDSFIVIIYRNRKRNLGFILSDHIIVKHCFDFHRFREFTEILEILTVKAVVKFSVTSEKRGTKHDTFVTDIGTRALKQSSDNFLRLSAEGTGDHSLIIYIGHLRSSLSLCYNLVDQTVLHCLLSSHEVVTLCISCDNIIRLTCSL